MSTEELVCRECGRDDYDAEALNNYLFVDTNNMKFYCSNCDDKTLLTRRSNMSTNDMVVFIPEPKHDLDDEKEFLIWILNFFSKYDLSDPLINKNILRAIDSSTRKRLTVVQKKITDEISKAGSQAIEQETARNSFPRKVGLRTYNFSG